MDKLPKVGTTDGGWSRVSLIRVDVSQGYVLPWGYGISYWSPQSMKAVCYPLFINWLVWLIREIYWVVSHTPNMKNHPMYKLGYKDASNVNQLRIVGVDFSEDEIEKLKEDWENICKDIPEGTIRYYERNSHD